MSDQELKEKLFEIARIHPSLLVTAVHSGELDLVEFVLKKKKQTHPDNLCKLCLDKFCPDKIHQDLDCALIMAAKKDFIRIADLLINHGARVDTHVLNVSIKSRHIKMTLFLLDKGAIPTDLSLKIALKKDNYLAAVNLLDRGIRLDPKKSLKIVLTKKYFDLVGLLFEKDSDRIVKFFKELSGNFNQSIWATSDNLKIINQTRLLEEWTKDYSEKEFIQLSELVPDVPEIKNRLFHLAIVHDLPDLVVTLIKSGIDINSKCRCYIKGRYAPFFQKSFYPLELAILNRNIKMCKILTSSGMNCYVSRSFSKNVGWFWSGENTLIYKLRDYGGNWNIGKCSNYKKIGNKNYKKDHPASLLSRIFS